MAQKSVGKVIVLATGGTIAGRAANAGNHTSYTAGRVDVSELLAGLLAGSPEGLDVVGEQLVQMDSMDMESVYGRPWPSAAPTTFSYPMYWAWW